MACDVLTDMRSVVTDARSIPDISTAPFRCPVDPTAEYECHRFLDARKETQPPICRSTIEPALGTSQRSTMNHAPYRRLKVRLAPTLWETVPSSLYVTPLPCI